jgi:hypothetical protein
LEHSSGRFPWPSLGALGFAALIFVFFAGARHFFGAGHGVWHQKNPVSGTIEGSLLEALAAFCTVPVLMCLAPAGPGGLGPAGILASLFFVLRDPLIEWFHGMGKTGAFVRKKTKELLLEWFSLYRAAFIGSFFALILYGLLCFWGDIPLLAALALVPVYAAVLVLGRWAESKRDENAFYPLPIKPLSGVRFLFIPVAPVFALSLLLALGLTLAVEEPAPAHPQAALPGPEEYAEHAAFQSGFLFRSLNNGGVYGS